MKETKIFCDLCKTEVPQPTSAGVHQYYTSREASNLLKDNDLKCTYITYTVSAVKQSSPEVIDVCKKCTMHLLDVEHGIRLNTEKDFASNQDGLS